MRHPTKMRPNQHALICAGSLFLSAVAVACGSGIREIEIKPDPPDAGQQIFTIRFAPNESAIYEQIIFNCALRQELVLLLPEGGQTNMVFESGISTARQRDVKMVKDVDCYVSFFVQLGGTKRAGDMAEDAGAMTNAPVTVARIKITAYRKGKVAWTYKTNAQGKYRPGQDDVLFDVTGANAMRPAAEQTNPAPGSSPKGP